jgi:nucleotidyltransferase substrate binding protein (TIGR01987 family)
MKTTRWQQRFENFSRAYLLLESVFKNKKVAEFSDLEKEGIVQRFEFTFELAWKTLKDYLDYSGVKLEPITPRHVIKTAFAAGIIADGQVWIDMLEQRNLMSHTYDSAILEKAIAAISIYLPALSQVYEWLKQKDIET